MVKNRFIPTAIVALIGAIIGSFVMMLYASTHFAGVAGPNNTPPTVSAAPLAGVSDQDRIVSAVKRTKASVVAITEQINGQQVVPIDPMIQQFFGGQQGPGIIQHYKGEASGSGFVFDDKGDIVTNAHVVNPPNGAKISDLQVVFSNGDHAAAHVVSLNVGADLAVIRVDNYKKLPPPLVLADSDKLEQGQWAIAIGEPEELQQTVTLGVISAFNREEKVGAEGGGGYYDFKGLLQTSAPINPGNSGGPLIDIDGRVIGVNQLTDEGAQGIGFAIPSNVVRTVVPELLSNPGFHQGTDTGFAGFAPADLTPGLRNQIGYTGPGGIGVVLVSPGTPADKAGLEPGDVVLRVDGKPVTTAEALRKYIGSKKPGDVLRLDVWSQGVKKFVAITLEERPAETVTGYVPQGQGQGP